MGYYRIGITCLAVLTTISSIGAQTCGNSGSNCASITSVSQCTADVYSQCCTRCNFLAGCFNIGSNCYTQYNSFNCYTQDILDNCCQFCEYHKKEYLGDACIYGDLTGNCVASNCGQNPAYDASCCETCYQGTAPTNPTVPTTAEPTTPAPTTTVVTTNSPDVCDDELPNCEALVNSVPSSCYTDLRTRCCASCEGLISRRLFEGFDIIQCPYGDRSSFCLTDTFNRSSCSDESTSSICCDTCVLLPDPITTPVPNTCVDRNIIECNLPSRYCYLSESSFYRDYCCATCAAAVRLDLPENCRYGDAKLGCEIFVPDSTEQCSGPQNAECCETCHALTVTTTVDPCQDSSPLCAALVGGQGANCYDVGDLCCASCRPFLQDDLPDTCKFGDRIPNCNAEACDAFGDSFCCATCSGITTTTTTTLPTTTESACFDTEADCDTGILQLINNKARCYNSDVRERCCSTCSLLANPDSATCSWGNRESICSQLTNINCDDDNIATICCERCANRPPTTTTTPTTTISTTPDTPPPNCVDSLGNCQDLTSELRNCYNDISSVVANGCCASCYMQRRADLPLNCFFGDRVGFCTSFLQNDPTFCDSPDIRRDCCESCHRAIETTTPTTTVELCSNEWSDSTCDKLLEQLGDCSTIQEKCCRTCTVTAAPTTTSTTTPSTTTEEVCPDVLEDGACELIISFEGDEECYTEYMSINCCGTCSSIVTTSTEPPTTTTAACAEEDSLPCLDLQLLNTERNICEEGSVYLDRCCNFCLSGGTVSTTVGTTTTVSLPPGCDGNVWSDAGCLAAIATSELDNPCDESQIISDNCCAACNLSPTTTTTVPTTTTPSGPVCNGDDPGINCESLNLVLGVCNPDSEFIDLCCEFCAPTTTSTTPITTETTTSTTTTGSGLCSRNIFTANECETVYSLGPGIAYCATDFMVNNCCLFCSQVTEPPTTTTEAPCIGDNPDLNCTHLDEQFAGQLCDPDSMNTAALRDQCCFYCANLPEPTTTTPEITTTTTEATTSICVDLLNIDSCNAFAATGACDTDTGRQQCCATCQPTTTTEPPTTTTTEPATTTECVDSMDVNCTRIAELEDPCVGSLRSYCCAYCASRPTPATTTTTTMVTLSPCNGDSFSNVVCSERNRTDNGFCDSDPVWQALCCEFCGQEVVSPATDATTVTPATTTVTADVTTSGQSGTTAAECTVNVFPEILCQARIDSVPDSCETDEWFSLCCVFCRDLQGVARRKRSVDEDAGALDRVRRQAECSDVWEERECEAFVYSSTSDPKYTVCIEDYMRENCCGYCSRVSAADVIPPDCTSDQSTHRVCNTIVSGEGLSECSTEFMEANCCLTCALAAIRTVTATTTTTTTTTTTASPTTTAEVVCKQLWEESTCLFLLDQYSCSHDVIKGACCDYYCEPTTPQTTTPIVTNEQSSTVLTSLPSIPPTTTTTPTTTITTTSTSTTTTEATTTPTIVTDPVPLCGVADNAQTCSSFAFVTPSGCYQAPVIGECCQTCTDYYYNRKAAGYNVEMCSYGNRRDDCTSDVDCTDPLVARECCDVCYPRESVTVRPVSSTITTTYTVALTAVSPCNPLYSNPESFLFIEYSKFVVSALQSVFSVLPGAQMYNVVSVSCDAVDGVDRLRIISTVNTSPTHTFNELNVMFAEAKQDGRVGLLDVVSAESSFEHSELFDDTCEADSITNCDDYTSAPNSDCYHPDPYSRCCVSCNAMAAALYADREYIPVGCQYGDKADECSADIDCSTEEAKRECCYTCAPAAADYTTPEPSTTTTTAEPTTTTEEITEPSSPSTSTTAPTTTTPVTTPEPCLGDISDRCEGLTSDPMNCYNDELVYNMCCESCDTLSRWDLPDNCTWGDKEEWCNAIELVQCQDEFVFERCCDKCGPHYTSTPAPTTSTTTIAPTTTVPCVDTLANCAFLTAEAVSCYDWDDQCCASCRPQLIDYLPETCRFGDKSDCSAYTTDDCSDQQIADECCQLCGPPAPTTTSTTSTPTTEPTTIPTTTDPGCVADETSVCNLLTMNGGCYNADIEAQCCITCADKLVVDAPLSCRYGDHSDFCTSVTRERCLTEVRVFEDCCETCEGLVAPPGVCVDTVPNCAALISEPAACYTDLIYSDCCYSCEQVVREDLSTTCRWGNQASFCHQYSREDCETTDSLEEQCCALCTEEVTTTTTEATVAPTTPTQPQCVDNSLVDCTEDTSERRFCYNEEIADDCCASCKLLENEASSDCPYGDKESWCQYFANDKDRCAEELIRETCCLLCAPPPTTTLPTTSACYDTAECSAHLSSCYDDNYISMCCETCQNRYDPDALLGCQYGDQKSYCDHVSKDQCETIPAVRDECCESCPILTATTPPSTSSTMSPSPASTTTTPSRGTTTTTQPPQCVDDETASCGSITPDDCYTESVRDDCCATCEAYDSGSETCRYGDRDTDYCFAGMDCSLSVVRELCCFTCAGYTIPALVPATYRVKVNVTSERCTAGLNDMTSSTYLVFKYQIELAITEVLSEVPGIQLVQLVEISCGSVQAILNVESRGFYDVEVMNRLLMLALADGRLGQLGVSPVGSSLTALSFQPPSCINGDFSLNCLTEHVLREPTRCYEANVRSQCCRSCSSLFYARLAAGADIASCPYGDLDAECFSLDESNCENAEARERCCDRCASFTTPTVPSTVPTTTVTTTEPCMDDDPSVCAQGVQNSLSFCYEAESMCCSTCQARRVEGLPESCAWGDKRDFCASLTRDDCVREEVNSTCCQLCGDHPVDPTAQPCLGDVNNYECTLTISSNPTRCYDPAFYSGCCESCNSARMDWLPTGCLWGDKADFCDATNTICDVFGDDVCCASCCRDCVEPTTVRTTTPTTTVTTTVSTTTTPTTTPKVLPPGCNGDSITTCADFVSTPRNCYSTADNSVIADFCCESCFDIVRQDLPSSCPYGNRIDNCGGVTWPQCADGSTSIGQDCCETCFDLLEICDEEDDSEVTNCEVSVASPGGCYSPDVLDKCCASCKTIANYNLPPDCRFGNKVSWCGDITPENIDTICRVEDYQIQCCDTCRDYVGMTTTTVSTSTTSTTSMAPSTRLPPNEQCPNGDLADNCDELTSGTGACYDPDISDQCCRTCYEEWRGDLPANCRYGDKSKYCMTTDEADVDYDWCMVEGDTCCARCAAYLTTTVPTTTLPDECPNGNTLDNCDIRISTPSDCYSPAREVGCCVECTAMRNPALPETCRYGDKAEFCRDISDAECRDHAETCCETCAAYLTTTTPVPTTTSTPIDRPSVLIGYDLFNRPVPPGDSMLFQVTYFTVEESCSQLDMTSNEFKADEARICNDMGTKFWSLTNCYVETRTCNDLGGGDYTVNYKVMILVDRSLNYQSPSDVTSVKLEEELTASQSQRKKRSILYFDLLIRDVNECDPTIPQILRDGCDDDATCTNTDGLYECQCRGDLLGDGFTCTEKIDPLIGRSAFDRDVPPGYHYLYKLMMTVRSTAGIDHGCFNGMNDINSNAFIQEERAICSALGEALDSLYSCYVEDFNCDVDFVVTAYIVIDAELNYLDKRVTQSLVKSELGNYNGEITTNTVHDVDECSEFEPLITNHCTADSTCQNSPGLYDCICNDGSGRGFVGVSTCTSGTTVPPLPVGEQRVESRLADWALAVIIIAAVIVLAAIVIGIVLGLRRSQSDPEGHTRLNSGEETPPRGNSSMALAYNHNSLRSTKAPHSELGSFYYAQQERELPGYAMKSYNDTYGQADNRNMNDTATYTFQ